MEKWIRLELKHIYKAPKPKGKREFLQKFVPRKISLGHMLYIQMRYISKWVWVLSVLFFFFAWYVERFLPNKLMSSVLSIVPSLAMVSVAESMRSVLYGMQELESASQFSLKSVIAARMGILGSANLILLSSFAVFMGEGALRNVLYLLVPYLFTAIGNLALIRKIQGTEGIFACVGFALAVSIAQEFIGARYLFVYEAKYGLAWLAAFVMLCGGAAVESHKTVGSCRI